MILPSAKRFSFSCPFMKERNTLFMLNKIKAGTMFEMVFSSCGLSKRKEISTLNAFKIKLKNKDVSNTENMPLSSIELTFSLLCFFSDVFFKTE